MDYGQYVATYQCNPNDPDVPLVDETLPTSLNQGNSLSLCIRGTASDDVDVTGIDSLTISQANSESFTYVVDGEPANVEVVVVICGQGTTDVCVVNMLLLGRLFNSNTMHSISVTGSVSLEFARRRILQNGSPKTIHNIENLLIENRRMKNL